ncbi:hypothetical protein INR49_018127, partial [Caranx melampygus]
MLVWSWDRSAMPTAQLPRALRSKCFLFDSNTMCEVMLVGDSGVGKTCLLVRFKDGAFLAGSFISTVGIDFR